MAIDHEVFETKDAVFRVTDRYNSPASVLNVIRGYLEFGPIKLEYEENGVAIKITQLEKESEDEPKRTPHE